MSTNQDHALASAQGAAEMFSVTYWVVFPDYADGNVSIFQNFTPGLLETSRLFEVAARMPFDIRELFSDRSEVLFARLQGFTRTRVIPIGVSDFQRLSWERLRPFNVALSHEAVQSDVTRALEGSQQEWLHISHAGEHGATPVHCVTRQSFVDYFRSAADPLRRPELVEFFSEFLELPLCEWPALSVDCPSYMHNVTHPNELALTAFGVRMQGVQKCNPSTPSLYISGPVRSARAVGTLRERMLRMYKRPIHANDMTVCVDSVAWGVSREDVREKMLESGASVSETKLIQAIVYRSGFTSDVRVTDSSVLLGEAAKQVISIRMAEVGALSAALILHSGLRLAPVLRLNPGVNRIRSTLMDIGNCARGNGPHRDFKLNKLGRRLSTSMEEIVGARAISAIRGTSSRIGAVSIVSDLPLELLPVDGVPLGLKHDVSRLPCNPGSVMFAQCANNDISFISRDSLDEVLVVRSFLPGDPIAGHLEAALARPIGPGDTRAPVIRFVDVETPEAFAEAVSTFRGSVMIFDGHGARDSRTGIGTVVVGGRPLDVWDLRHSLTLPPIVLLSACDTYPIDGSHASAAVGLLALGARTVLGTLLPIHSIRSSVFLSRLIFRLTAFLPIAMDAHPHGVNWRYVMSGMLRMVYASELIYPFASRYGLLASQRNEIQYRANTDINCRNPRWLQLLEQRLAAAGGIRVHEVRTYRHQYAWITDALKYVQLGRPELVQVVARSPEDVWAAASPDAGAAAT